MFSLVMLYLLVPAQSQGPNSGVSAWVPTGQAFERLQPDAAWCGPRVVYFFACYFGHEPTLEEVVAACMTDSSGLTTMENLTVAADRMNLGPTPVRCNAAVLMRLGGPAIICIRNPSRPDGPVHFVALVSPSKHKDFFVIVDPSLSVQPLEVHRDLLAKVYAGQAILLKGCPHPYELYFPYATRFSWQR